MAWHTPKTWDALYEVTAADMNYELRDLFLEIWVGTTAGDIDYYNSSTGKTRLAKGTARQVLAMNSGATAPEWQNSPQSVLTATGDLLYASGANTLARLPIGSSGQVLNASASGSPAWVSNPVFVPLTAPLTSTSWDGDTKGTTAKTKIDLSSVFGAPAGIKAISARLIAADESSTTGEYYFGISPNATAGELAFAAKPAGCPDGYTMDASGVCPCDASGDIYYQIVSSGGGSMTCWLQIWGYWV